MDYSQFLLLKEELSLILVIVILFVADLFMSPDAHKNDGKPVLNTMLPVALLTIHTLITIVPGPVADAFGGMYHNQPIQSIVKSILSIGTLIVFLMAHEWMRRPDTAIKQGEFYILTLSTLLGMYFMISAGHFLMFFIAIDQLARCLSEGFVFQGQANRHGTPRGEPSGHLEPSAFVLFLQNHDQVGNRALGERLTRLCPPPALRAATGLLLLAPMIPLLFMGDDDGSCRPFLFFTDFHDQLADAVREGRRGEFAHFTAFADPEQREHIPDPNAEQTFESSRPQNKEVIAGWHGLYQQLLELRRRHVIPHLPGSRSLGAEVHGDKALTARWRLGDGNTLRIDLNLAATEQAVELPAAATRLFDSSDTRHPDTQMAAYSCVVSLLPPDQERP